jgi:hypothetical protein
VFRLDPAAEDEIRKRLGHQEADAFLARLEHLPFGGRHSLLALRSGGVTEILPTGNRSVLAYRRIHPRGAPFLSLTNFSDTAQSADAGVIARVGLHQPRCVRSTGGDRVIGAGRTELPAGGFA